jgi:hypothetical protein
LHPPYKDDGYRRLGISGWGMTQEELLAEFPDLTAEDIRACLAFAADRERKLATLPGLELGLSSAKFTLRELTEIRLVASRKLLCKTNRRVASETFHRDSYFRPGRSTIPFDVTVGFCLIAGTLTAGHVTSKDATPLSHA